jgi:hypothetical protein
VGAIARRRGLGAERVGAGEAMRHRRRLPKPPAGTGDEARDCEFAIHQLAGRPPTAHLGSAPPLQDFVGLGRLDRPKRQQNEAFVSLMIVLGTFGLELLYHAGMQHETCAAIQHLGRTPCSASDILSTHLINWLQAGYACFRCLNKDVGRDEPSQAPWNWTPLHSSQTEKCRGTFFLRQ